MRVLIVDDSVPFRQAARALLERRGYDVVGEADDAAGAIDAVAGLAPDAVLLDVLLPDGSGFGVCATITCTEPAPAVLLMSSEDFGPCFALAEECGARGFVLKARLAQCELGRFFGYPRAGSATPVGTASSPQSIRPTSVRSSTCGPRPDEK